MPDYGHELSFGAFITPSAAGDPVALAQAAERAGLDLVTFQDHPYQPRFLDTWTLLSWVAARTQRVRVVPNVANLPLRPPAVLARAAASLDLLSGGRVELGLGAGAFWDAIAAMGGPRRRPGAAVQALTEAIAVIRGAWDADSRERFSVAGAHYQVDGAKRGPAPAHRIQLWIGGYGPRMLALIGRQGDGWLPSLSYMDSVRDLAAGNAAIDDAATVAGREPGEIRRLVNLPGRLAAQPSAEFLVGPVTQWVEQLGELALAYGCSAFIVPGDDEELLTVVGQEVAPAVRELVAAERSRR